MIFSLKRASVRLLILAAMALTASGAQGIEPETPLARLSRQAWTMENGLPQNTVPVLLQSREGYLFAGTELGLARFDGNAFEIIGHATIPGYPEAEIRCLLDMQGPAPQHSLWVGTGDGLIRRTDGNQTLFTTAQGLPSDSIRGLVQSSDGALWVWTEGGLARWNGTRFQPAPQSNNRTQNPTSLAAGVDGELWVGTVTGAEVLRSGQWIRLPGKGAALVTQISGRDVLISNSDGVFLEHQGRLTSVMTKTELPRDGVSFLGRLADGTIAAASKSDLVLAKSSPGKTQATEQFAVSKQLPGSRIQAFYTDREGALWIGTNHGLARVKPSSSSKDSTTQQAVSTTKIQQMPTTDPLAVDAIASILEDHEGDLWVGTETAGLHVLRDTRFRIVGTTDGLSSDNTTAIVEADAQPQGTNKSASHLKSLWIGTRGSGLTHFFPGEGSNSQLVPQTSRALTTQNGLLSDVILSLAVAPQGDVWVGTPDGLNRISSNGQRVEHFTSADGLPDDFIRSLLVEPDNSIWIGTRHGLTHLVHGHFQNFGEANGLGSDLVGALARSLNGDLWIATLNGLSRWHQGSIHNYTVADGLSSNVITALDVAPNGMVWVGTQNDGVNLWDGRRIVRIHATNSETVKTAGPLTDLVTQLPTAIHSILHDDRGHLWLASNSGLTRADQEALLDCGEKGGCDLATIQALNFSTADGLRSRETSSNSHPTACRMSDGSLWFTTPRGVVSIDPSHMAALPAHPPIVIERFSIDDQDFQVGDSTAPRISAGHFRFQFDYAGLSFAAPQKLRYEYKLEGFDHSWIDAGTRRSAYYTNIQPGTYRFRVRTAFAGSTTAASDKYSEADFSFQLLPHYYQTTWFRAFMALAVVASIVIIFRRRVSRVRRELRAVMAERNRIAREIHDTLAQGYVGISLQLEILGELLRHNRSDAAANHLALTQGLVREGLQDARQSIWALRSQDTCEDTLPVRLQRMVEKAQQQDLTTTLDVHGAYRSLGADVEKEILRIGQEAIQNVKRHARASRMDVRLDYDEQALMMSVSDDGRGFLLSGQASKQGAVHNEKTPQAHTPFGKTGNHFGLIGMKERAVLIHAELRIASEPGQGTTLTLRIPTLDNPGRGSNPTHGPKEIEDFAKLAQSQPTHNELLTELIDESQEHL